MKNIFIKNPTASNVGFALKKGPTAVVINEGPAGSINIDDKYANVCLAPPVEVPEGTKHITDVIELEGRFVVQVGGEVVPYIFNAEDLGKYFNAADFSGTGVEFVVPVEDNRIVCVSPSSFAFITPTYSEGPHQLKIGGEVVGEFIDGYAIQDYMNTQTKYDVTYQIIPGGGSGSPETYAIWMNNGDVGVPIELNLLNPNEGESYHNNSLSGNEVDYGTPENDPIGSRKQAFCLGAKSELFNDKADLVGGETTDYGDSNVSGYNDLTITFPNGETVNGFLAATQPTWDTNYEFDVIGVKARALGYNVGISFGGGSSTYNNGLSTEGIEGPALYIENHTNSMQEWVISGPNILGVYDPINPDSEPFPGLKPNVDYDIIDEHTYKLRLGPRRGETVWY